MTIPRPDDRGATEYPTEQAAADTTFTMGLPRCPITSLAGRNPLVRTSDRVEAVIWALTIVVSLLAIPMAAAIGTAVYDSSRHAYAEQALTRHIVTATVTDDDAPKISRTDTITVQARWVAAGTAHTGAVQAPSTTQAGDHVQIWVDDDGSPAEEPAATARAATEAATAAVALVIGAVGLTTILFSATRIMLDRIRATGWQRDIDNLVGHGDGHTTRNP
jgi:hypothetical protein